jgi:NAD(P)-dependent dehydrogenase (short-subunit alcohol dehydrogenase family)
MTWENARLGPEAFDLSGKRALVMGAASSVGHAIALAFSEVGADVTVTTATPDASEALAIKRLAREIATMGPRREPQALDASLGTAVQVMVRQVVKDVGGLDILVTAPDLFLGKEATKTNDVEWSRILSINLSSVFYACRAVGREMVKQRWGRIINVASALGERGLANSAAYCAAKAGVMNLTRALAQEWGPHGVTVNCIAPAWLEDTPGLGDPDPQANQLIRFIPMRRPGNADEVAPLALYLASEASGYVSGQTLFVDGGLLCHL